LWFGFYKVVAVLEAGADADGGKRPPATSATSLGHRRKLRAAFKVWIGGNMPKAYAVVSYRSTPDPQRLAEYAKLALPAVSPFGARILARGDATIALEHGLKERTVVVGEGARRRSARLSASA
jgi:uncharacterized protein (DUF1330 family)